MHRLFMIIVITVMVFFVWFYNAQAGTKLIHHSMVTDRAVQEHQMEAYLPCMDKKIVKLQQEVGKYMQIESAKANALSISKACDIHLRVVGNWLLDMGESRATVMKFLNIERFLFREAMTIVLKGGTVVNNKQGSN